nr:hypothetical protein CcurKRNrm2_p052 [Cryptomonas curvata]
MFSLFAKKLCFLLCTPIFYVLTLLKKRKKIQNLENISIKKEKLKEYKKYLNQIFFSLNKSFFKNKYLVYSEQKKKLFLKRIDNNIEDSFDMINKEFLEFKKKRNAHLNINESEKVFMRGEVDYFQKVNKKILEFDKENFYLKINNLKIKKEKKENLKEIINKYILDVTKFKKNQLISTEKDFIKNKLADIEFNTENEKAKPMKNLMKSDKNNEKKNIITLINQIFNEFNILFLQ